MQNVPRVRQRQLTAELGLLVGRHLCVAAVVLLSRRDLSNVNNNIASCLADRSSVRGVFQLSRRTSRPVAGSADDVRQSIVCRHCYIYVHARCPALSWSCCDCLVVGLRHMNYLQQLDCLGLWTLEERRN